jgi:cytoskeletal protein CcmA (bactofilin family)
MGGSSSSSASSPVASSFRPAAAADTSATRRSAAEPARPVAPAASATASSYSTTSGVSSSSASSDKGSKANRRVLTVGNDILMRGEITNCDRFVIEGQVDAKVSSVHTMELAESGAFKGVAEVEEAEISGVLEGELVVRGRLVIYATGKVRGKVTYGEIEIERGGEITGEIKTISAGAGNRTGAAAGNDRQKKHLDSVAA